MRALKVLALVLMPLVVLAACDQKKSDAATASAGVAGPPMTPPPTPTSASWPTMPPAPM